MIENRRFCSVAMLDSDLDSRSMSVLVDASELVSELEEGVDCDSFGRGQLLWFSDGLQWVLVLCIWLPWGCLAVNASLFIWIMFLKPW